MGRVRVLDDHLVNRIAAGEVIERPASVVKELLENSLDAGARRVDVQAAGGGKRLIRLTDDGVGMEREDALLSLERHATSKLARFEDLEAITTLGFRGEALPSIAAVSRLLLRTAARDGEGTEIEVRGGRIVAVREVGIPRGTTVEVASLFFNVPARRKFLRADTTEMAHIGRVVGRYALAHPDVRFVLDHEGRVLLDAPAVADTRERVAQVHGESLATALLPFESEADGIRITGFAGRPVHALPRRDGQYLFVNRRLVQDRVLSHAIAEAYGNTVPKGSHPTVILFVAVDPGHVDVNVHPQKTEVRFHPALRIHDRVREAVAAVLSNEGAVPTWRELRPQPLPTGAAEAVVRYLEREERRAPQSPSVPGLTVRDPERGSTPLPAMPRVLPLAQYRSSYILAQDEQGLLVVDQHVAHERVLFERYLKEAEENRVEVQRLLTPLVVEVSPEECLRFEEEREEFHRLGFIAEPFGTDAVRVDAVPALADRSDLAGLFRQLLGEAGRSASLAAAVPDLRLRLVTTAACKAAIKIHEPMSLDGMAHLLDDLFRTQNPTTCPHGRPVLFRLTLEEIERAFGRR